jgi:hypothetical protein
MFTHHNRTDAAEDYRDDMICLAIEQFLAFEADGVADEESLVIVANALHDIRVRDVLVLEIVALPPTRLMTAFDCLEAGARCMPSLTLAGIVAWALGAPRSANSFAVSALHEDQNYSLAQLLYVATKSGLPYSNWASDMLDNVSYESARGL